MPSIPLKLCMLCILFTMLNPVLAVWNLTIVYVRKNPSHGKTAGPGGQGYMDHPTPQYPPGTGELADSVLYARHALAAMELDNRTDPAPYGVDFALQQWQGTEAGMYLAILLNNGMADKLQTVAATLALIENDNDVATAIPVCIDSGAWPLDASDADGYLRDYEAEKRAIIAHRKANGKWRGKSKKARWAREEVIRKPVWLDLSDQDW